MEQGLGKDPSTQYGAERGSIDEDVTYILYFCSPNCIRVEITRTARTLGQRATSLPKPTRFAGSYQTPEPVVASFTRGCLAGFPSENATVLICSEAW
jgi:hypothetical protein